MRSATPRPTKARRKGWSQPLPSHSTPAEIATTLLAQSAVPSTYALALRSLWARSGIRPQATSSATAAASGATTNPGHCAPGTTVSRMGITEVAPP